MTTRNPVLMRVTTMISGGCGTVASYEGAELTGGAS